MNTIRDIPDILLLVCPPTSVHFPSTELASLTTVLVKQGIKAEVFDVNLGLYKMAKVEHRMYWHRINRFLWHEKTDGPLEKFKKNLPKLVSKIVSIGAPIIYVDCEYPNELYTSLLIGQIKEKDTSCRILVGGKSSLQRQQREALLELSGRGIDHFVPAPVEVSLCNFLEQLKGVDYEAIPPVDTSQKPDKQEKAATLKDDLPRYDHFSLSDYRGYLALDIGRGCPAGCLFCKENIDAMSGWQKSVSVICSELEYYIQEQKIDSFYFRGISFNNHSFAQEICLEITERFPNISWMAKVAPWQEISFDLLEKMRAAGCQALDFCALSGSDNILATYYASEASRENIVLTLQRAQEAGLRTGVNILLGFPGESFYDYSETQRLLQENLHLISEVVSCVPLALHPGTPLFEQEEKRCTMVPIAVNEWSDQAGNTKVHRVSWLKEVVRFIRGTGRDHGAPILGAAWNVTPLDYWRMRFFDPLNFKNEPFHPHMPDMVRKYSYGAISLLTGICEIEYGDMPALFGAEDGRKAHIGPEVIHLDLTNRCNLNCIACWDRSPLVKNDDAAFFNMSLDVNTVLRFIDDIVALGGTRSMKLTGGGEPTMHPQFLEILKYIRKKDRYLDVDINTNGTLFTDSLIHFMIDSEINLLTVSLWAATPETYVLTHPNQSEKTFERVIGNMRKIVEQRKGGLPRIFIHNVLMNCNYHELEAMLLLALDIGVEEVHFTLVDPVPGKTESLLLSHEEHQELLQTCEGIREHVDQWNIYRHPSNGRQIKITNFNEFCVKLNQEDVGEGVYDRKALNAIPCYIGWLFTRVMADGRVVPCCKGHRLPMGNINTKNFIEIWNDKKYQTFRHNGKFLDKSAPYFSVMGNEASLPGCANCDNIMHNTVMHDKYLFYSSMLKWVPFKLSQWSQKRK